MSSQVVVSFGLLHNVKEDKAKWHKAQSDICESICDSEIKIYGDRLLPDRQTSQQNITKISEVLHIENGVRRT